MSFKPWNPLLLTALLAGAGTTAATAQNIAAAQKSIELERYNEARVALRGASTPEANFELGRIYQMRDLNDSAATAFNKAGGATPFGMVAEGRALLLQGNTAGAEAKFDAAAKAGKMKDVRILTLIAQAYAESDIKDQKSVDKAITYVQAAETASKGKDNPALMVARGDIYLKRDNGGGEAMSSYDRAITANANDVEAYYKRGALNVRSRNGGEALTNLNKAIALDANYAPAYKELAEVYFISGQYDKAASTFQQYMDRAEKSNNTTAEYAAFLYQGKKYPEALEQINKVLAVEPNNFTMNRLKAYSLYETKDYAGAATAMDQFMKIAPADKLLPQDYSYYSRILLQTGKQQEALTVLDKAIAATTDPAQKRDLLNDKVTAYNALKQYDMALNTQRQIAQMPGSDLTDQYKVAVAFNRAKRYTQADSVYNIINTAKPTFAPAYLARAQANYGLDPESAKGLAKPYYEKYIELTSATPDKYKTGLVESYDYLGYYSLKNNDKATAKSYFEKTLALDPADENAVNSMKIINAPAGGARRPPVTPKKK